MALFVSLTLQDVYTRMANVLRDIVPAEVPVIQGWENMVPMPVGPFVLMRAVMQTPHRTPVETYDTTNPDPAAISIEQGILVRMQCDHYGPLSFDWAATLTAIMRTEYGCGLMVPMSPLYCKEPKQAAITNAEAQFEQRWIVDALLQYNPVISTPMQFADQAEIDLIEVDERYPPT